MYTITNIYSDTDKPDKQGRWARKVYYQKFIIARIDRQEQTHRITYFFPTTESQGQNITSTTTEPFNEVVEKIIEKFETFKNKIK